MKPSVRAKRGSVSIWSVRRTPRTKGKARSASRSAAARGRLQLRPAHVAPEPAVSLHDLADEARLGRWVGEVVDLNLDAPLHRQAVPRGAEVVPGEVALQVGRGKDAGLRGVGTVPDVEMGVDHRRSR